MAADAAAAAVTARFRRTMATPVGRIPIGGGGLRSASAFRMRAQRIRPDAEALSGGFPQSSPDDDVGAAAEDERGVKVLRRDPAE